METGFAALAAYIAQRREAILQAWRNAVTSDPTLTSGASLPRTQLHDHIPALLVDFEQRLAAGGAAKAADAKDAKKVQKGDASAHGLHRWQQGFDLAEVARELSQLNECVVVELDRYAVTHPEFDPAVMASARRIWAQQYGAAIGASTSQYFRLQQLESNSHIRTRRDDPHSIPLRSGSARLGLPDESPRRPLDVVQFCNVIPFGVPFGLDDNAVIDGNGRLASMNLTGDRFFPVRVL